jgi:hypothetical protein
MYGRVSDGVAERVDADVLQLLGGKISDLPE